MGNWDETQDGCYAHIFQERDALSKITEILIRRNKNSSSPSSKKKK
jgi:hypothetical protein